MNNPATQRRVRQFVAFRRTLIFDTIRCRGPVLKLTDTAFKESEVQAMYSRTSNSIRAIKGRVLIALVASMSLIGAKVIHAVEAQGPARAQAQGIQVAYPDAGLTDIRSLDVYIDHRTIHVLLAGSQAGAPTPVLRYLRSKDGGESWSAPMVIESSDPLGHMKRGNDVQIAAAGKRLVAVWQTTGTGFMGGGPLVTAISDDGGTTWAPGPNPANDSSTGGHSFVDIAAAPAGVFHLVWLDNREAESSPAEDPRGQKTDGEAIQGLRQARSADGGRTWSPNTTVDSKTCSCCWNTLTASPKGALYLLYRDAGPRDMRVAQSVDGGVNWHRLGPAGAFNWKFDGCPHMGGGLAVTGDDLHSIVWTGEEQHAGLYYLRSLDGGRSWARPIGLGGKNAGHSDLAALDANRLIAVWDAAGPEDSAILAAQSSDSGRTWSTPQRLSAPGVIATHPRAVATPFGVRAFWTESRAGAANGWAMARL